MGNIVRYFQRNGAKMFDVKQALRDSGWGVGLDELPAVQGLQLIDRKQPGHTATISAIKHSSSYGMWFIYFENGGWQCLDHAIEQFAAIAAAKQGQAIEEE